MRTYARYTLGIGAAVALLAGCGALPLSLSKGQDAAQPPISAPGAIQQGVRVAQSLPSASTYRVLYRFRGKDGANPIGGLIDIHGRLYGTTAGADLHLSHHFGSVFSLTISGAARLLHRFDGAPDDGAKPGADMINVRGTVYGTTPNGGSGCSGGRSLGCGTVFSITRTGTEKVLHSFDGASDGRVPSAGLIYVKGRLYGTTAGGGDGGSGCTGYFCGTVFSITTNGTENVLYCFCYGTGDGLHPAAGLIDVNGTLYGTTEYGGDTAICSNGCGTVFSVTTAGTEKVLYRFGRDSSDGVLPNSSLINVNGTLYGTTQQGGAHSDGTVFSVTTSGKEKVLYSFGGGFDGMWPYASLINVNGTLYGTTYYGGGIGCLRNDGHGCGTVFALKP
ncbi:MAG TPA: choice-of-anchor tandem repeat GloVer-containing protein [Candidatus Cybelea sp.]